MFQFERLNSYKIGNVFGISDRKIIYTLQRAMASIIKFSPNDFFNAGF